VKSRGSDIDKWRVMCDDENSCISFAARTGAAWPRSRDTIRN
jgi:hypothetical protein